MEYRVKASSPEKARENLIAVGLAEGTLPRSLKALDERLDGALKATIRRGDFEGEADQVAVIQPSGGGSRVVLIGMGEPGELKLSAFRRAASIAGRQAVAMKCKTISFSFPEEQSEGFGAESLARAAVEGIGQGVWTFDEFRGESPERPESAVLLVSPEDKAEAEAGVEVGRHVAAGQALARRLQALPGNICTPEYLGAIAKDLAQTHGFKATVMTGQRIKKEGMESLLSVAQGSARDARFIILEHRGAGRDKPICLVGKGVTFDTGGISIKPAASMEEMKYDMSGAAAVLGAMEAIGRLKPSCNVIGVVPTVENMPSDRASRPGDIVRSHLGKTIEIINTDAEGRLILVDALSWVRRYSPAAVIDAATLTGAVVVGLGHHATGLMTNDESLGEEVRRAGETAGERCWPLPMFDEYKQQLRSDFADIKNTGGRPAGSITAGWFLREFVDGYPWVHLDIAGTAYTGSDDPAMPRGPTGVGVRLFTQFVLERAKG